MKKVLLFLVAGTLLLSCKQSTSIPNDSVVKWNEGDIKGKVKSIIATSYQPSMALNENNPESLPAETDVTLQVYNTKGKLSESRWYDSDSTLVQRILFDYNVNGLPIRNDYIDYTKDTQEVDSSYFLFIYNDNGKITREETYHNGKLYRWAEIKYNNNNDIVLHQSYQDNEILSETKYEHRYNNDKRKTEEKTYTNGVLTLTMSWEYDQNGRTTAVKTKDGEVGFTESYRYDDKNRLIEETLARDRSDMKHITAYQYDQQGNMTECVQRTEGGNILRRNSYTYDDNGNWIRSVEEAGSSRTICERKIEYYE